jgi:hypothetical protein
MDLPDVIEGFIVRIVCWLLTKLAIGLWWLLPVVYSRWHGPDAWKTIVDGLTDRKGNKWAQAHWLYLNARSEVAAVVHGWWNSDRLLMKSGMLVLMTSVILDTIEGGLLVGDLMLTLAFAVPTALILIAPPRLGPLTTRRLWTTFSLSSLSVGLMALTVAAGLPLSIGEPASNVERMLTLALVILMLRGAWLLGWQLARGTK